MSRNVFLAATLSLVTSLSATPSLAQEVAPSAQAAPRPADAATRAAYDRADALSRSVFWTNEHQINPLDPVAGVKMAQALRELGQFDQAAQAAETVLTAQPPNVEAMLELGRAHIARGQAFYGIAALERARDTAPRDWRPLSLLGVAYRQVRRTDDAQIAWAQALSLSPENPDVLTNSAISFIEAGDLPQAEQLLRRASARPDASMKVRQNLALVLGLQGKTREAENILRRDLPPEVADQNLSWLASRMAEMQTPMPVQTQTATSTSSPSTARTWDSLQQSPH